MAGLVTGLLAIPEGMAYAGIGGFNPVAGVYSGVVSTIVGSMFARGADLHRRYRPGSWLPHGSPEPRATLAELPTVAWTVMDVLASAPGWITQR